MYFGLEFLDVMFFIKFPNLNLFPSQMSTHDPQPSPNYPISIIEHKTLTTSYFCRLGYGTVFHQLILLYQLIQSNPLLEVLVITPSPRSVAGL